jgi:hypothetical protein
VNKEVIEREYVVSKLAQRIHERYLDTTGREPWKSGKVSPWALEYAEVAVDALGWDDEAITKLGEEGQ